MKIRTGFVSNSSSSSFVVFIPDGFIPDWNKYKELMEDNETTSEECQLAYDELLQEGELWEEGNYSTSDIFSQMFQDEDMIIASFDSGPDSGQTVLANKDKIMKLIERAKQ